MKLTTKISRLQEKVKKETERMLLFIFPCGKSGQQLEDEKNKSCNDCDILHDCVDYYGSMPNQKGKTLSYDIFLKYREFNKKRIMGDSI